MAAVRRSWAVHLLPLLLLCLCATSNSATINITNLCSYTVWPAAVPIGGGMQLDPGKSWILEVPAGARSSGHRIWPRTGCSFDGKGNRSCQTGDCNGLLACKSYGQPPNTIAEFTTGQFNGTDFFNISLIDGFNVPMDFLPVPTQGGPGCSKGARCTANITSQCPNKLQAPGGCNNPCTVFKQDRYCCTRNNSSCEPTAYSLLFAQMCPDAYSYSWNDSTSTVFTCPTGTNYQVIFCPSIDATTSPPFVSKNTSPPDVSKKTSPDVFKETSQDPLGHMSTYTTRFSPSGSMMVASALSFIFIVAIIFFIIHMRMTRLCQAMEDEEEDFGNLEGTPMRFTFQQLEVATEQFRDKLGEGGFGSVFKGQLGEEIIAVKRLDRAGQGKREFLAEVQTIGSIHHINLVRLIGFCAEKSHRLLVYEYMPKGSLDKWIYCRHDNSPPPMEWRVRCKIITNIAKGLSYLHEECMKKIAHLDVKPQNILLDENFGTKLSDFGLCKLIDRDMSQVVSRMRGTPGYLAPEWLTLHITEKADVYSFGVVVMEIVSGRKNLDTSRSDESLHLITMLENKVKSDQLVDLIDKNSNNMQAHEQDVIQMMKLAMWCLQIDCKRRPKMSEVVKVLEGTMDAESNIDHNFVATNEANFGIVGSVNFSAPPVASDVSGPR